MQDNVWIFQGTVQFCVFPSSSVSTAGLSPMNSSFSIVSGPVMSFCLSSWSIPMTFPRTLLSSNGTSFGLFRCFWLVPMWRSRLFRLLWFLSVTWRTGLLLHWSWRRWWWNWKVSPSTRFINTRGWGPWSWCTSWLSTSQAARDLSQRPYLFHSPPKNLVCNHTQRSRMPVPTKLKLKSLKGWTTKAPRIAVELRTTTALVA